MRALAREHTALFRRLPSAYSVGMTLAAANNDMERGVLQNAAVAASGLAAAS